MAKAKEIGRINQVRSTRRTADITQAEVAGAVRVSRQTIVSIEAGNYAPSVYLALRLAALFGTTVEALFGGEHNHDDDTR